MFRIVIKVSKDDNKGKAITLMSMGLIIMDKELKVLQARLQDFLKCADQLKQGQFSSYGVACIVDEKNGKLIESHHIG